MYKPHPVFLAPKGVQKLNRMYKPHPGISLQAADVYSFRIYVAAAAMIRYLIARLGNSRAEKKKALLILSDCLQPLLLNLFTLYGY